MKSRTLRIAHCFLLSLTFSQIQSSSTGACFDYDKRDKKCLYCYKSKQDPKTGNCGPVLPESDTCLVYYRFTPLRAKKAIDTCVYCKKGFWNSPPKGSQIGLVCAKDPNPIENCLTQTTGSGKKKLCSGCLEGFPSPDGKSCLDWSKAKVPIKDCKIGVFEKGGASCRLCKDNKTYDEYRQTCKVIKGFVGCLSVWTTGEGELRCSQCNSYNGYTMDASGNCSKVDQSVSA